jgi:hypothetical protein
VSPQIWSDDLVVLIEKWDLVVPQSVVEGEAMDEKQRWPSARHCIVHLETVNQFFQGLFSLSRAAVGYIVWSSVIAVDLFDKNHEKSGANLRRRNGSYLSKGTRRVRIFKSRPSTEAEER